MTPGREEYERWLAALTLDNVRRMFLRHGAKSLLCKVLPRNANSKNQVYVASDLSQLSIIPSGDVVPFDSRSAKGSGAHGPVFHVPISLLWITPRDTLAPATGAQFVAYPQYPEVRLSGFLRGCREAPSFLFDIEQRGLEPNRLLVLGLRDDRQVLALALPPESVAAREFQAAQFSEFYGVFAAIPLRGDQEGDGRSLLLRELCRIHHLGWITSTRLDGSGALVPCNSTNCGGYTLEAHLGIRSNGIAEPDFHGWEVKARIDKVGAAVVTLFTPEPDGGVYATEGPEKFIRKWGYADTQGRADRLNFGGIYRSGCEFNTRTNTQLVLDGYDGESGAFDAHGAIRLLDRQGTEAASWSFAKLITHWKKKHAQAAYVPYVGRLQPERGYQYGSTALLGEGAEFRSFLKAVADGLVYYDPGIKLENVSSAHPQRKLRSQFRVRSSDLQSLYQRMNAVQVCDCA